MIHCLSKIGEDLFFEATKSKLILRTLNASRSAYFAFSLSHNFFEQYTLNNKDDSRCKVLLKPCLAVFRSLTTVDKCIVRESVEDAKLVFELHCKMGVRKTYRLNVEDCEPLQAIYDRASCRNRLVAKAKLLADSIGNFSGTPDEVTLVLQKNHATLRSYVDDQKADDLKAKVVNTTLTIGQDDFETFELARENIELTFCLKEMKAILGFCEAVSQPVSIFIDEGGKPILLSVKLYNAFEADFVLATLIDPNESGTQTSQPNKTSVTPSSSQDTQHSGSESSYKRVSPSQSQQSVQDPYSNQSINRLKTPPDSNANAGNKHARSEKDDEIQDISTPPKKKAKVASDDEIEDETAVWGNDLLKEDMDDEGGDVPSGQ